MRKKWEPVYNKGCYDLHTKCFESKGWRKNKKKKKKRSICNYYSVSIKKKHERVEGV